MRRYFSHAAIILLLQYVNAACAQQLKFNQVIDFNTSRGSISDIAQDQQGYIWLSIGLGGSNGRGGVYRYDGSKAIGFFNDPANPNSLANNWAECLVIDSSNIVWIGTYGSGLDKYDPATNKFTHFTKNNHSLANDTVTALLEDHNGNLWVGTYGGLNLMDKKTGKFTHYTCDTNNVHSLSNNEVRGIYEDRQGTLWVGCGSVWDRNEKHEDGGLNRFDRSTGTFTRYLHDPSDPNSIANNKVRAMFEDRKGNFWVGTAGDGLHIMNRAKGTFTHYYYDSTHPERLSRPPFYKENSTDHITFITEDITGCIWIGSFVEGINKYDPNTKKITHYGRVIRGNSLISAKDTVGGFNTIFSWATLTSKGGLLWISTLTGSLYTINPFTSLVKYFPIKANANSFYKEPGKNALWIATEQGLIRKDMNSGNVKTWRHDPRDINSLCDDNMSAIRVDDDGDFWLATSNGLCKFDPNTNHFSTWRHEKDKNSLSSNLQNSLFIDHDKNIWIGTAGTGLDKLDTKTGVFTHFQSATDSNSLVNNQVISVCEDPNHTLWIGTARGVSSLANNGTKFKTYLKKLTVLNIYADAKGIVWAGSYDGLYRYDGSRDQFVPFTILGAQPVSDAVLNILEDNDQNLWIAATNSIIKINSKRDGFKTYGEHYDVHKNTFTFADNFKASDGELFMGDQEGYYAFFPNRLQDNSIPPQLSFSTFRLGDEVMQPGQGGVLKAPIWRAGEIKLKHDQNIFSFDFIAMNYGSAGEIKYFFMLENYDNTWHNIGTDHTAYFFNVPPGNYIFHAKVISTDGTSAEKKISIIIMPPWWQTWWAYCTYVLLLIVTGLVVYRFIKQRIIQNEQEKARVKELAQAKEIEKAYHNLEQTHEALKATQAQLVQSEKMASLGELTAGIAHEIQNPLNFVNNFSDVNKEMLIELNEEIDKGNYDDAKSIAKDVIANEEKINHHGKRADAIVKNMLQHSRQTKGVKEPTDINALADEYLRLSYHGLRAKDKSFNADFRTDFDESVGKIDIIPQDIGRVLLNLFNNAFYVTNEKQKAESLTQNAEYKPLVSVHTKKINDRIEIRVSDNGNGIPQNIVDKIFQPFFTTKPTGQGTGLGLSLSYDIIKAHGGEIKVTTKEGEGSEFIIQLPVV